MTDALDAQFAYEAIVAAYREARGESAPLPGGLSSLDLYLAAIDSGADVDAILNSAPKEGNGGLPAQETPEAVVEFSWTPFDGDPDWATYAVLTQAERNVAAKVLDAKLALDERMQAQIEWETAYKVGVEQRARQAAEAFEANDPESNQVAMIRAWAAGAHGKDDRELLQGAISVGALSTDAGPDPNSWVISNVGGKAIGDTGIVARITKLVGQIGTEERSGGHGFTVTGSDGKTPLRVNYLRNLA